MKVSKALERVWRWKEQVYQDIKGMSSAQRVAYFKQARQRLEARVGVKLELPRPKRHRVK